MCVVSMVMEHYQQKFQTYPGIWPVTQPTIMEDKVAYVRRIAEMVGVDLIDVLPDLPRGS